MPTIFEIFQFSLGVTLPIFFIVLLGTCLTRYKVINKEFIHTSSNLVFRVGLPVMLFTNTATQDFSNLVDLDHLTLMLVSTLIVFAACSLSARWQVHQPSDKGVFIQGAFRGNLIIIGLAFCANAYGDVGIAIATLPMAITIIVYNLLSVYALNASSDEDKQFHGKLVKSLKDIAKNPLIIGITLGFLFNASPLTLPDIILETNQYLAQMTLPLALLGIGGTLDLRSLRKDLRPAVMASLWKLLISPVLLLLLSLIWPVDPVALGVLFLLAASPTATASFTMVQGMQGNSVLAANIIIITTLASMVTIVLGLSLLMSFGLIPYV